jgi:hypothetical protein
MAILMSGVSSKDQRSKTVSSGGKTKHHFGPFRDIIIWITIFLTLTLFVFVTAFLAELPNSELSIGWEFIAYIAATLVYMIQVMLLAFYVLQVAGSDEVMDDDFSNSPKALIVLSAATSIGLGVYLIGLPWVVRIETAWLQSAFSIYLNWVGGFAFLGLLFTTLNWALMLARKLNEGR